VRIDKERETYIAPRTDDRIMNDFQSRICPLSTGHAQQEAIYEMDITQCISSTNTNPQCQYTHRIPESSLVFQASLYHANLAKKPLGLRLTMYSLPSSKSRTPTPNIAGGKKCSASTREVERTL